MIYFNYPTDQGIQAAINARTQPKPQPKPATEADHNNVVKQVQQIVKDAQKGK